MLKDAERYSVSGSTLHLSPSALSLGDICMDRIGSLDSGRWTGVAEGRGCEGEREWRGGPRPSWSQVSPLSKTPPLSAGPLPQRGGRLHTPVCVRLQDCPCPCGFHNLVPIWAKRPFRLHGQMLCAASVAEKGPTLG